MLRIAASFHDIGKIGIPDNILLKPGKLDDPEWDVMRSHPQKSEHIMDALDLEDKETICAVVRHHHERFDGDGYPDKLSGEHIPALARILSVADTYDAMARQRVYSTAKPHDFIMRTLEQGGGLQHDAYMVDKFSRLIRSESASRLRAA